MPTYNATIDRTGADALIPEEFSADVIASATEQSAALSLFPKVTMSSKTRRLPVLSALPVAYWVDGDTGLKQTTSLDWEKKVLEAEELAAIVPIPEAVLDDSAYDIWAELKPRLGEAIGRAVDAAVLFGTNKPSTFGTDLYHGCESAANVVYLGTATQANGGVAGDLNNVMGKVEADGFDVNGFAADRTFRAILRGARDTTGQKLLDVSQSEIEGQPLRYVASGLWGSAAKLFAGDTTKGIVGIRRDITYKVLTEAVIQDGAGEIVYNLAQQDMVALRVVFRCAWQVANPVTHSNATEATRFPFALLHAAS